MDEFKDTLMGQHVDVGSSSDEAIHVLGRADIEEDINTVDYLLAQNWIDHLSLYFAAVVWTLVVLEAGWVPGYIAVLATTDQDYLFEVAEVAVLAQFIQKCFPKFLIVLQWQLI